jgi:hypothetical protein
MRTFTGVQPADKYGWSIMAGISLNLPMIAQGDKIYVETAYGQGTPGYEGLTELDSANSVFLIMRDQRVAAGWAPDATSMPAARVRRSSADFG